jgi:hypothetical protein
MAGILSTNNYIEKDYEDSLVNTFNSQLPDKYNMPEYDDSNRQSIYTKEKPEIIDILPDNIQKPVGKILDLI